MLCVAFLTKENITNLCSVLSHWAVNTTFKSYLCQGLGCCLCCLLRFSSFTQSTVGLQHKWKERPVATVVAL